MIKACVCGVSLSITWRRMGFPPISSCPLSPPPMRRASPPARITPAIWSIILACAFPQVFLMLFVHLARIGVEDDAILARQGDEAPPPRSPDEGELGAPCKLDARSREARTRHQNGYPHLHAFDDHFRSETPRRV